MVRRSLEPKQEQPKPMRLEDLDTSKATRHTVYCDRRGCLAVFNAFVTPAQLGKAMRDKGWHHTETFDTCPKCLAELNHI